MKILQVNIMGNAQFLNVAPHWGPGETFCLWLCLFVSPERAEIICCRAQAIIVTKWVILITLYSLNKLHIFFEYLSSNPSSRVLLVSSIKKMAEMYRDFTSICKNLCLEACFSHAHLIIDQMSLPYWRIHYVCYADQITHCPFNFHSQMRDDVLYVFGPWYFTRPTDDECSWKVFPYI